MSDQTDTDAIPRYRIAAGGMPTIEEAAALAIALTPVTVAPTAESGAATGSGWLRAALHEGVGGPAVFSARQAADLR
jgi:hypothetical protein